MRIENEASERTALDVLSLVRHSNLPLSNLIRLKGCRIDAVVIVDGAAKNPIGRRTGIHFDASATGTVRIDLHTRHSISFGDQKC